MITIKINMKKLRKHVERVLVTTIMITFFLLLGFAGSYEVGDATTGQFFARVLPTLAVMGLSVLGLNKIEEKEVRHE